MLALMIEDVTLVKQRAITAAVRFRGGAATTLTLPRPLTAQQMRVTHDDVLPQGDFSIVLKPASVSLPQLSQQAKCEVQVIPQPPFNGPVQITIDRGQETWIATSVQSPLTIKSSQFGTIFLSYADKQYKNRRVNITVQGSATLNGVVPIKRQATLTVVT